jgi:hypothetical protein
MSNCLAIPIIGIPKRFIAASTQDIRNTQYASSRWRLLNVAEEENAKIRRLVLSKLAWRSYRKCLLAWKKRNPRKKVTLCTHLMALVGEDRQNINIDRLSSGLPAGTRNIVIILVSVL